MITTLSADRAVHCLTISGALDAEGALALRPVLEEMVLNATGNVVLDVAEVHFMDGCGVGAIGFLFKRLAAQGRTVQLRGAAGQPLAMVRRLRLAELLGVPAPARRRLSLAAAFGFQTAA